MWASPAHRINIHRLTENNPILWLRDRVWEVVKSPAGVAVSIYLVISSVESSFMGEGREIKGQVYQGVGNHHEDIVSLCAVGLDLEVGSLWLRPSCMTEARYGRASTASFIIWGKNTCLARLWRSNKIMLRMHLTQLSGQSELNCSGNGWRCYFRGLFAKNPSPTEFCLMDGLSID